MIIIDRSKNNLTEKQNVAGYEVVSCFNYLSYAVTDSKGCKEQIRRCLIARSAAAKLTDITKKIKLRLAFITPLVRCRNMDNQEA